MDPHFHEYLGAVAGMNEVYGRPLDEGPSEFHGDLQGDDLQSEVHLEHRDSLAAGCCDADCHGVAVA